MTRAKYPVFGQPTRFGSRLPAGMRDNGDGLTVQVACTCRDDRDIFHGVRRIGGNVEHEPSPDERAQLTTMATAAGLGCSIVVSIVLFIGGGVALDRITGKAPIFVLVGVVLGMAAAGYQLVELARVGQKGAKVGPVTKLIQHVPTRGRKARDIDRPT